MSENKLSEQELSNALTSDKAVARTVAGVVRMAGIRDVVISPGSRNAPLTAAFAAEEEIHKCIIVDERIAAFVALGKAQASQKPVALVCTSGTAMLNYSPAIAEAFYQGLPLIVITADRPSQWIDQDDSQTIRQFAAMQNFVKGSYDLSDAEGTDMQWLANRTVNDALIVATSGKPGPVHINVHLDAPLGGLVKREDEPHRLIKLITDRDSLPQEQINSLADKASGMKILLIAGFMQPDAKLNRAVRQFADLPNVTVMAETISNLHLEGDTASIDVALTDMTDEKRQQLAPDIVITIGGALISRKIKEYIRSLENVEHWSIGHNSTTVDCFRKLTLRIEASPAYVLRKMSAAMRKRLCSGSYKSLWEECRKQARTSADRFIASAPWSDLTALDEVFRLLPESLNLQLANGTSIRYAQLLTRRPVHATFCNRGVSGIDGCTTTAIGAASVTPRKTLLLTGDTAFCYDLSALSLSVIPADFKIILLNNSGGGIFRFIDSTRKLPILEECFCAPQNMPVEHLCKAFSFNYLRADSHESLKKNLPHFLHSDDRPQLLEIVTDPEVSASTLLAYMARTQQP